MNINKIRLMEIAGLSEGTAGNAEVISVDYKDIEGLAEGVIKAVNKLGMAAQWDEATEGTDTVAIIIGKNQSYVDQIQQERMSDFMDSADIMEEQGPTQKYFFVGTRFVPGYNDFDYDDYTVDASSEEEAWEKLFKETKYWARVGLESIDGKKLPKIKEPPANPKK